MPSKPLRAIKPMFKSNTWRILEGDVVEIIAGKDKGKQGKVLKVIRDVRFPRVLVENLNIVSHASRSGALVVTYYCGHVNDGSSASYCHQRLGAVEP